MPHPDPAFSAVAAGQVVEIAPGASLLEVGHVAHRMSVSQEHVRRLIRRGELRALRFGRRWRVDPLVLREFIAAAARAAASPAPRREFHSSSEAAGAAGGP